MSAAAYPGHTSSPRTRREHTPTRDELLDLLAESREWTRTLELVAVGIVVERQEARPHDAVAERRILGAMLLGRATLEDLADVEPGDFYIGAHADLYRALRYVLTAEGRVGVRLRPSERRGDPRCLAGARARVRRRATWEAARHLPDPVAAWAALETLPWPGACPVDAIATVRALGRWRRGS